MAFDPAKPSHRAPVTSAELRDQFNGLKELIDAKPDATAGVVVVAKDSGPPVALSAADSGKLIVPGAGFDEFRVVRLPAAAPGLHFIAVNFSNGLLNVNPIGADVYENPSGVDSSPTVCALGGATGNPRVGFFFCRIAGLWTVGTWLDDPVLMARTPSGEEKAALAGTSGTPPDILNRFVDNADPRLAVGSPLLPGSYTVAALPAGSDALRNKLALVDDDVTGCQLARCVGDGGSPESFSWVRVTDGTTPSAI